MPPLEPPHISPKMGPGSLHERTDHQATSLDTCLLDWRLQPPRAWAVTDLSEPHLEDGLMSPVPPTHGAVVMTTRRLGKNSHATQVRRVIALTVKAGVPGTSVPGISSLTI